MTGAMLVFLAATAQADKAYRLEIPEIACGQCTARIEQALRARDGIERIESDVAKQTVTVWMRPDRQLDRRAVEALIDRMGFSVRKVTQVETAGAGGH